MYDKAHARVHSREGTGQPIDSIYGVLQGGILSPKFFNEFMSDLPQYFNKDHGVDINNLNFTHLSYADDIVIISDTSEGLQSNINALHTFCCKWHLIVNASKTKILEFNRSNNRSVFHYNSTNIEQVDTYKYLGQVITNKKNPYREMWQYLSTQAQKALFTLKSDTKDSLGYIPPQLAISMFDTYIRPILEYNSEIWSNVKQIPEAIQLSYLKSILGVRKQTPTLAIYAETGRFPLITRQKISTLKYWARAETMPSDSKLKLCLNIQKQLHSDKKSSWFSKVVEIAQSYNCILPPIDSPRKVYTDFITNTKSKIYGIEIQEILSKINDSTDNPKLRTYKIFKQDYRIEPYLIADINKKMMNNIARFRTSSHNLRIETGRHDRPIVAAEHRFCERCNLQEVEDEFHYLLICPALSAQRSILFQKVGCLINRFDEISNTDKFKEILISKHDTVIKALGEYINATVQ
jgi:hypothetical protein